MKEKELEFKSRIQKLLISVGGEDNEIAENELTELWDQILGQEFNDVSPEFVKWFKRINSNEGTFNIERVSLWVRICEYLHSDVNKESNLAKIEKQLKRCTYLDKKSSGAGLLPDYIADGVIVRNVYLDGDKDLVGLFGKLLPIPPSRLFPKNRVPKSIQEREGEAAATVQLIIEQKDIDMEKLESVAIKIQREFRGKKRKRELELLVKDAEVYHENISTKRARKDIDDANTIYQPKCDRELSNRLLEAAKKIEPFETIRHLTDINAIPNILDDGLLGRKSLLRRYHSFRQAALGDNDVTNGDANVICFAAFDLDSLCMKAGTAEFILDLNKLRALQSEANNPCIFFKQKDLGFELDRIRAVKIGNKDLLFTHTEPMCISFDEGVDSEDEGADVAFMRTNIKFFESPDSEEFDNFALIPNFKMISSNFKDMHPILAMNFFRFLDEARDNKGEYDKKFIDSVYSEFAQLDNQQLVETLLTLTRNMCDTMEFNFYGSFLMNPALIKEINIYDKPDQISYKLNMQEFIASLQDGDLPKLGEVQEKIPQLFQSYRFIDYLLPQIEQQSVKKVLLNLRKDIQLPLWRQRIEEEKAIKNPTGLAKRPKDEGGNLTGVKSKGKRPLDFSEGQTDIKRQCR